MLLHNYDPCRETSISFQIVYALFQARVVMVTRLNIPWTVRFSVHCPLYTNDLPIWQTISLAIVCIDFTISELMLKRPRKEISSLQISRHLCNQDAEFCTEIMTSFHIIIFVLSVSDSIDSIAMFDNCNAFARLWQSQVKARGYSSLDQKGRLQGHAAPLFYLKRKGIAI